MECVLWLPVSMYDLAQRWGPWNLDQTRMDADNSVYSPYFKVFNLNYILKTLLASKVTYSAIWTWTSWKVGD